MNNKKDISDLLRNRLRDYQKPVGDDVWTRIERELPNKPVSAFWKIAVGMLACAMLLVGLIFFFNEDDASKPTASAIENNATEQTASKEKQGEIPLNEIAELPHPTEKPDSVVQKEISPVSGNKKESRQTQTDARKKVAEKDNVSTEKTLSPEPETALFAEESTAQKEIIPQRVIEQIEKDNLLRAILLGDSLTSSSAFAYEEETTTIDLSTQEASELTTVGDSLSIGLHDQSISADDEAPEECNVIPSLAFSPNNDEIDDRWTIENLECLNGGYTIHIYDRLGILLMRYTNNYVPWDGRYSGREMPPTDYWYVIKPLNGKAKIGHFTLMR